jgi:hypothetical protein
MAFDPARLRKGEIVVGAGSIVLLASMFLLKWYGFHTVATDVGASWNGWHGLTTLRWFMLATAAVGLALVYFQAARGTPAVPVTLSVIVPVVALITFLPLVYRVLINEPGPDSLIDLRAGAFLGLLATLAITVGGYMSMREEGVREADGPQEIPTIPLSSTGGPSA